MSNTRANAVSGVREPYSAAWNYEVAVYKGDEMIHSGTVKTAAEFMGVQKRTILYYLTPSGRRRADRMKKQHKIIRVVRI